jgi:hypothetical protein
MIGEGQSEELEMLILMMMKATGLLVHPGSAGSESQTGGGKKMKVATILAQRRRVTRAGHMRPGRIGDDAGDFG